MSNEIIIFEEEDIKLEVSIHAETVWISQSQMAQLFEKSKKTISEHIRNIFKSGELEEELIVRKFRTTASDGKKYITKFYNLDMIISVGYRVNSRRGILFRRWASTVLKEYLLNGYVVNQPRLDYLEKTVKVKYKFK